MKGSRCELRRPSVHPPPHSPTSSYPPYLGNTKKKKEIRRRNEEEAEEANVEKNTKIKQIIKIFINVCDDFIDESSHKTS